ncbi:MAG: hypothetical protein U0414_08880 [Polyangiaceae bacterium]
MIRPLHVGLSLALLACGSRPAAPASGATSAAPPVASIAPSPSSAPSASPAPSPEPPPSVAGEEIQSLAIAGFEDAALAIPVGATDPRPIVVAAHGNFDKPEWQCEIWSTVFQEKAFVLCPRGKEAANSPRGDTRYTYSDHVSLEKEIDAGVAALRASSFAPWLAPDPPLYAGFSLGSIMGVGLASRRAKDFPNLVLVEGGLDRMTDVLLRAFVRDGGKRMMLVCAQAGCAGPAQLLAQRLDHYGGVGRVVDAGNVGHRYDGPVADAVAAALPSFLTGDPLWEKLLEAAPPQPADPVRN